MARWHYLLVLAFLPAFSVVATVHDVTQKVSEIPLPFALEVTSPVRFTIPAGADFRSAAFENGGLVSTFSGGEIPGCRIRSPRPSPIDESFEWRRGEILPVDKVELMGFFQGPMSHPPRPGRFIAGILQMELKGAGAPLELECHLGATDAKQMTVRDLTAPLGFRWQVISN